MGYPSNGYYVTPYIVGLLGAARPRDIHDILLKQYPHTHATNTYRYLQMWGQRDWIRRHDRLWYCPQHTFHAIKRRVLDEGWPQWLQDLGYSPSQMTALEHTPEILPNGNVPVDPSIFDRT